MSFMKKKIDVGLVISWIFIILGLVILIIFILGKSFGFINSPVWVNYIPHIAGGFTLLGIALQTGKVLQKIKDTGERVTKVDGRVTKMDEKLDNVVIDVNTMKSKIDLYDKYIEKMGSLHRGVSQRLLRK